MTRNVYEIEFKQKSTELDVLRKKLTKLVNLMQGKKQVNLSAPIAKMNKQIEGTTARLKTVNNTLNAQKNITQKMSHILPPEY